MTSQTLVNENAVSPTQVSALTNLSNAVVEPTDPRQSRLIEALKSQYRLDQQVEFLNLQAETESLLKQLQALKQQRSTSSEVALKH